MYHYMGDLDCKVVEMEMIMRERVEMILCVGALNDFLVRNRREHKKVAALLTSANPSASTSFARQGMQPRLECLLR